jgi:phosphoenolpyruvate synthase/pyruvate phosphate dikinase
LTLFNVLDQNQILEGIKNVWASPYTERSFKWRQKYLLNPENVYPSILIIPSVNNDYSGVVITKGIISGKPEETTMAFSRGVGGSVEGQASETWVLGPRKFAELISPSREPMYTTLPKSGGIQKKYTTFYQPFVKENDINTISSLRRQLNKHLQTKVIFGPYDIELGFKDSKLWLFQVRPFVENKKANSSKYLESITPKIDGSKILSTSDRINNI